MVKMTLSIMNVIIIFVCTWWIALFIILPIGIKRDEHVQLGNDAGAPVSSNIKSKLITTTVVAFSITLIASLVLFIL